MSGNSFRWPVKGRIISEFGARPDGGHNDGIDLAVPQGTSVKAAENGVVAYAGNELKGYGNLVLIRHANNWVSAYANNEEILVKRGDKVTRGQTIAKAGATGSVSQPQVHFELRKGSRPVDPTKYMSDAGGQRRIALEPAGPSRPARSWIYCQATRPERLPREMRPGQRFLRAELSSAIAQAVMARHRRAPCRDSRPGCNCGSRSISRTGPIARASPRPLRRD